MKLKLLAATLAAAALLPACVTPTDYNAEIPKSAAYTQIDSQLKADIAADKVQIEQLQNTVKLTLANGVLFDAGGSQLDANGQAMLTQLAPALKDLPGKRIVVAGYTDNVPIGPELLALFPGNIELSRARADAVAKLLVAQGVPQNIVSTVGLGASHPVADNSSPQGRAQNRRVEIDIVDAPL